MTGMINQIHLDTQLELRLEFFSCDNERDLFKFVGNMIMMCLCMHNCDYKN